MARVSAARANTLIAVKMALRFGLPLIGVVVFGRAIVLSVGGDIERWQFGLGVLLILAGFISKVVPRS
ncbi:MULTISPECIES: hypothetical protein [Methylobacterium]|jgi:hypothetical protein|uniref:Uncharacterized protein n=3 Tax=Methylobacterium TaxID=407 RepID=A0AAE8HSL2_9HYPH|nr:MULTISPECIES: hypothetical protein [Methylobacterium]KOX40690.1 hypothetical protein ADL19_32015 [Streptomyces purpurogeneiscleroticus]AIQ91312.1 protein of unassigned function [Methylobacterium oryzae CBMB20]APT31875.1 hypothetical protein MCBMB27_02584 [Methylobacterium phyllosphaerae]AWV16821.1 hypothetical protein A3862_16010 [Methylobacterium sp. XJLW]MBA9062223.1 hypothetical protein [Methylobacterium fujisawaense]